MRMETVSWHGKSSMIPPFVVCLVSTLAWHGGGGRGGERWNYDGRSMMRMDTVSWHGKSSMIPPFVVCLVSISLARRGRERRGKVKLWWVFHDENGDGQIIRWHGKSSMIPPFVVCLVSTLAWHGGGGRGGGIWNHDGRSAMWMETVSWHGKSPIIPHVSGLPCKYISLAQRGRERRGNVKPR